MDNSVKVWTWRGDLSGNINLVHLGKNSWDFPFDWVKLKLSEIDEVFR